MRILVYPHDLAIGGSQINAIDLAAGVAAAGHEVLVYGVVGPLVDYIRQRGLRFIPARPLRYRPAPSRIAQLMALARRERLDLIHAYEWPPCLDACFGAGMLLGVPVLCTVLGMVVMPYVPASVPLVMGTVELGIEASKVQKANVWVIEPPIDTEQDHPGIDGAAFRATHRVLPDQQLIVTVSRLSIDLKLDALVRAIDAADLLACTGRVRLVVVGDGAAYAALRDRSAAVNRRWGREVITMAGAYADPRPAYAAAQVVVGMGSSSLRALAIGKAVVVQGEHGFSEVFGPDTLELFLRQGFYGLSDAPPDATRLAAQLSKLLERPTLAADLGRFGREVVVERFSLRRAVQLQLGIYEHVLGHPRRVTWRDGWQSARRAMRLEIQNHDPRQKQYRSVHEHNLISAARQGTWPPLPMPSERVA